MRLYARLAAAGFRRHSTYRQAMLAGVAANVVFGFLRTAILVAVVSSAGTVAGYDVPAAVSYVWLGQGIIGFINLWGDTELGERVRSGDVVVDLYRPWDLQAALYAQDVGRAGFTALIRFVPPTAVGAVFFPFHWPDAGTWPLFALSLALSLTVSFGVRFLVNLSTFWLLDNRGIMSLYNALVWVMCGLGLPLAFFPDWARTLLWCTPFPSTLQAPVDVYLGHGPQWITLAHQVFWAVALILLGRLVLARAVRRVVVQGG
ncbi:ABC-2 family transporter protein [Saccharothrix violaceirubra]|uniref:ABC-2 type transport system permease protein n=1 Tax=Saccharothrix violaceirubra TaxID=413306 RepID=A0A7W7T0H4_9PSEU|nr:ABC-2 family transporter protein [Saccharothrix violaceirubra]MBB4963015.1 ABC-2 type transport system permease protein [Saccharothrix violaceirubra]